jgi:hypothetical protein
MLNILTGEKEDWFRKKATEVMKEVLDCTKKKLSDETGNNIHFIMKENISLTQK